MGMNIMRMKGRAKMMRTIKVTGKGKIAVKPDKIRLYVNKEGLCQEFGQIKKIECESKCYAMHSSGKNSLAAGLSPYIVP